MSYPYQSGTKVGKVTLLLEYSEGVWKRRKPESGIGTGMGTGTGTGTGTGNGNGTGTVM